MKAAKCYLHGSALNPVLLVLQTSKYKQVTQLNTQAGPTDPSCVICGTANHHTGWPLDCACLKEEVTRARATGPDRAQQSNGGICDQEINNNKCSSNSESQDLRLASQGQPEAWMLFPHVHSVVSATAFFCGRTAGLETTALRELGERILKFQMS